MSRSPRAFRRYFVYFVDKDYAFLFGAPHRFFVHRVVVDKFIRFFVKHHNSRFFDGEFAFLSLFRQNIAEYVAYADFRAAGREFHGLGRIYYVYLDYFVVVIPLFQSVGNILFEYGVGRFAFVRAPCLCHDFNEFSVHRRARLFGYRSEFFFFHEPYGTFHKIANHRLDVSADVADFRIFGGFYLYERCADEFCKSSCYLRFAHARRSFHNNVFGRYFFHFRFRQSAPSVTVTERERDRLFRFFLTDNVFIEFFYYLFRT